MRAILCHEFCEPEGLSLEEVASPVAGAGEVVVDVHATGMNFPDCLMIAGKYQSQPPFPFSPGGELAGTISSVGSDVENWQVGDAVIALTGHGGLAEQVAVSAARLVAVPKGMDMTLASAFSTTYGTSYYALKQRATLAAGETLLVLGAAGGVGLAAVELGKVMGARVIAAASSDEKLEVARAAGADDLVNYSNVELKTAVKELTGGRGADVIYDPVGGGLFDQCMRCINWNGRLLIIGFASGDIPLVAMNLPLLKNCQIVGVFYGAFSAREPEVYEQNRRDLVEMLEAGTVKPLVGQTFALEESAKALRCLMNRQARGKVVVKIK